MKGAIHEQLASVKSGEDRAAVNDRQRISVCVCVLHGHMSVSLAPHDIDVCPTRPAF